MLIVTIPDLSPTTIRAVAEYLTENLSILVPPHNTDGAESTRIGGGGCPLVIEVADGVTPTLLSDRTFWTLVCGTLERPGDLVEPFVRSVIAADCDPVDRQTGLVGEDALYAWFDTCFGALEPLNMKLDKQEFRRFHDLFFDYLQICDMTCEVRQHHYIKATLPFVDRYLTGAESMRLAAFRMFTGQYELDSSQVRYWLRRSGMLKLVIDELQAGLRGETGPLDIGPQELGWHDADYAVYVVSYLIEQTYGSDEAQNVVLDYVLEASGIDVRAYRMEFAETRPDLAHHAVDRVAAADLDRPRIGADTGFHRRDKSGIWQRLDEVA